MNKLKIAVDALSDKQIDAIWQSLPGIEIHNRAASAGLDTQYRLRVEFAKAIVAALAPTVQESEQGEGLLRFALRELLSSLPEKRDWLNPDAEKVLRDRLATPAWTDANDICQLPPDGWYCTRKAGHDGPCAAHQHEPDRELDADDYACIANGMARIKAGTPPAPAESLPNPPSKLEQCAVLGSENQCRELLLQLAKVIDGETKPIRYQD